MYKESFVSIVDFMILLVDPQVVSSSRSTGDNGFNPEQLHFNWNQYHFICAERMAYKSLTLPGHMYSYMASGSLEDKFVITY